VPDAVRTFETLEAFLEWERQQEERYEYLDGVVTMMTGGSLDHTTIADNIKFHLRQHLQGKCRVFGSDAKVILGRRSIYPDVSVTCASIPDGKVDIVPDPIAVIEVVSPSSRDRDIRVKKLRAFQTPSVQHYAVVEQDIPFVDLFSRAGQTWANVPAEGLGASVELTALGISIPLAAIYDGIVFSARSG
jgi:Uma2 family endonuclease